MGTHHEEYYARNLHSAGNKMQQRISRKFHLLHAKQASLAKVAINLCTTPRPDVFYRRAVSLAIPSTITTTANRQTQETSLPDKYNVMPPRRGATRLGPRPTNAVEASSKKTSPRACLWSKNKTIELNSVKIWIVATTRRKPVHEHNQLSKHTNLSQPVFPLRPTSTVSGWHWV